MANSGKTLQTRIQLKHDTEANWVTAGNNSFIPLAGEIIIYDDLKRVKIGDGTKTVNELDWATLSAQEIEEIFDTKMDKENPTGTGSFSLNRTENGDIGEYSFVEGYNSGASGYASHAEGLESIAIGDASHAEGGSTLAEGACSHAEGVESIAMGAASHAEGTSITNGLYSHAEGESIASGSHSHAEGSSETIGEYSHAEGYGTIAQGIYSHVQGSYNITDDNDIYVHIVGNGAEDSARSNAHTLDWDGNGWFAGDVYVSSTSGTNKDSGSKKLATEEYVDEAIAGNASSGIYVQADAPENPKDGDLWVDTDDAEQTVLAAVATSGSFNDLIDKPTYGISNITGLQTALDAKANSADIATTKYAAASSSSPVYFKISDFGAWGSAAWYAKGFSMLIYSRAGEMVWVAVSSDDSNTNAKAIRLLNTYSKILNIYYSISESALYVKANAQCNNVCAHIISNLNGDYVPAIAQVSALASDAVEIKINEFGATSSGVAIGNSSGTLTLTGSGAAPTYNGANLATEAKVQEMINAIAVYDGSVS